MAENLPKASLRTYKLNGNSFGFWGYGNHGPRIWGGHTVANDQANAI
jgi:hypothetical protein